MNFFFKAAHNRRKLKFLHPTTANLLSFDSAIAHREFHQKDALCTNTEKLSFGEMKEKYKERNLN
jgi:hypothetical protein